MFICTLQLLSISAVETLESTGERVRGLESFLIQIKTKAFRSLHFSADFAPQEPTAHTSEWALEPLWIQ
jgi:hypothetical protein